MNTSLLSTITNNTDIFTDEVISLSIVYSIFYLLTIKRDYLWDIFTRLSSTYNACRCVYMVIPLVVSGKLNSYNYLFYSGDGDDDVINALYCFAAYLMVDVMFIDLYNSTNLLSILHHVVGGFGIYLIADNRMGLWLGIYFAWTEISTPLLNLSYFLYKYNIKNRLTYIVFGMFYLIFFIARILTIPLLINYLYINSNNIGTLDLTKYIMAYGGSGTLMLLNTIWFVMLSKKLINLLR